jgi:pyruvate formate lyase activating enzyme
VGFKGFSESTYRRYCGGSLFHVLRSVETMYSANLHLELTYLLIPDVSTTGEQPIEFARWVSGMDRNIPVHYVAYHPDHLWSGRTAPSPSTVDSAVSAALENGLRYVYGHGGTRKELNTACSCCGHVLIRRPVRRQGCPPDGLNRWCTGFDVLVEEEQGCCPSCGSPVPFVNLNTPRR